MSTTPTETQHCAGKTEGWSLHQQCQHCQRKTVDGKCPMRRQS